MSLSKRISSIRMQYKYSQEKFAEVLGVSKQAVQKWESGISQPEIQKLVKIAKNFNVSIDSLLLDRDVRIMEDMRSSSKIMPNFETWHVWESYSKNLVLEYKQSFEEGLDIEPYKDVFDSVSRMPECDKKEKMADILFDIVTSIGIRDGYEFVEPSDLEGIKLCRNEYVSIKNNASDINIADKVHGAWLGRIAGCLLGKTVEGMHTNELIPFLKETNNYPMHRYIRKADAKDEICDKYHYGLKGRCYADDIKCAPADDDTNYTVLSQMLIEKYGLNFEPSNVAEMWISSQPKDAYCTAERVTYRNLVNGFCSPQTALYKNPYREWIGAQIRTDYYGYINPGDPEKAAEMAWRDASISHVKNGIYGAMFVSAMIACAATTKDIKEIVLGGLSQIPQKSRLTKGVLIIVEMFESGKSDKECFDFIHNTFDEHDSHDWCHTISNAMIVVASLLYGKGDFGKSICLAVQTGFDTDCNGATVGSIVGLVNGASCVDESWSAPLNGKLSTNIFGMEEVSIEKLVGTTIEHIKMKKTMK